MQGYEKCKNYPLYRNGFHDVSLLRYNVDGAYHRQEA